MGAILSHTEFNQIESTFTGWILMDRIETKSNPGAEFGLIGMKPDQKESNQRNGFESNVTEAIRKISKLVDSIAVEPIRN